MKRLCYTCVGGRTWTNDNSDCIPLSGFSASARFDDHIQPWGDQGLAVNCLKKQKAKVTVKGDRCLHVRQSNCTGLNCTDFGGSQVLTCSNLFHLSISSPPDAEISSVQRQVEMHQNVERERSRHGRAQH